MKGFLISTNSLIEYKEWGNLTTPSLDVYRICLSAESAINNTIGNTPQKFNFDSLIIKSFRFLDNNTLNCTFMKEHIQNQFFLDNHRHLAIKCILDMYFKVRFHFMAKNINSNRLMLRKKLKKIIHFTENK